MPVGRPFSKKSSAPVQVAKIGFSSRSGYVVPADIERVLWRPVFCGGYDDVPVQDANKQPTLDSSGKPVIERKHHHFTNKACDCPPGPQIMALYSRAFETALGGGRGGLKGQPLTAMVMTPFGPRKMGDLKVGSQVSNPDGSVANVIGIYPLGKRELFRVTFSDGASTLVTNDHLWIAKLTCRTIKASRRYAPFGSSDVVPYKMYTTEQLHSYLDRESGKVSDSVTSCPSHVLIPLTEPVEFVIAPRWSLAVDPYVLGVLLGDGYLGNSQKQVSFSSGDREIIDEMVRRTGKSVKQYDPSRYDWKMLDSGDLISDLRKLGVYGKLAQDKFVPDRYKFGPIHARQELLRGLIDTDGTVDERGHLSFCSTSKRLAEDVQFIARSLGARASIGTWIGAYKDKFGNRVECAQVFNVYIRAKGNNAQFCKLARKKDRCTEQFNGGVSTPHRRMVSIEPAGEADAQCIAVDHPNQLYITDDFIVTHNTETGFAFSVQGNRDTPEQLYIHHPRYRFLVLRKNSEDLRDWFSRARQFYSAFGATFTESPMLIRFPSGAEGVLSHMQDENAYEKYQGQEFQRIILEELTQIPTELLYIRIIMSCRSTIPGLLPQVFVTANPGGKGNRWFKKRFVDEHRRNEHLLKPGTLLYQRDAQSGLLRTFVHSTVYDNPYFMRDNGLYVKQLEMLPENERKRWLLGDFDAVEGQYFSDFRSKRYPDEPAHACHVISASSRDLLPHWHRWIGVDWGYRHCTAVYWFCQDPNGQVIVYREMVYSKMGSRELGAQIAIRSQQDLRGLESHNMTIWISVDAWGKRDDPKPPAHQLNDGIKTVLGPDGAYVPETSDSDTVEEFFRSLRLQGQLSISIRPAKNHRVSGWQYCRELLNWKHVIPSQSDKFNYAYWMQLAATEGACRADAYRNIFTKEPETLPKLLITDACPRLIAAIPTLIEDETGEDVLKTDQPEDDIADSFRHGCVAHQYLVNRPPQALAVAQHLDRYSATITTDTDRDWATRKAIEDWEQGGMDMRPFNIPRASRPARARVN